MKIRINKIIGGSLHGTQVQDEIPEGYHSKSIVDENGIEYCLVVYDHCNLLHTLLMNVGASNQEHLSLLLTMGTLLDVASIAVASLDGLPTVKKQWFELYEAVDTKLVSLGLVTDDSGTETTHKDNA